MYVLFSDLNKFFAKITATDEVAKEIADKLGVCYVKEEDWEDVKT